MTKKIHPYLKLFFLFFLFLFGFSCSYLSTGIDFYTNYGFSYAISIKEIPYLDFNMVVPPFSAFLYSIPLFFNNSLLSYYIFQSLLLTIFCYFLFKLLNNKAWIFLIISFLPFPFNFFNVFCPGYNFLLILFFTILLYLEKNKKSDKVIGFILGLAIITKQTTGVFLLIPTIILFFKERKKFVNRIKYIIIPPLILLIYLFLTKSLISFFDLCFLGLIDFGNENNAFSISYLLIVILIVSYVIYKIVKNKNVSYIYLITMLTFVIPICDCYHMILFFSCFLIVFLNDLNINPPNISILSILVCFSFLMCFTCFFFKEISNFKLYITNSKYNTIGTFSLENEKAYDKLNKISKKYKKVIYLCGIDTNLYLKIINKRKIDYYDYCNHGNFGYNGIKKMLKKLSNERDTIVIIRNYDISKYNFSQFSKELVDYVKNNYKLIEKVDKFLIYYKK